MALMAAAASTADLYASHTVGVVFDVGKVLFVEGSIERRPSGAGVKLLFRIEERQTAQAASVNAIQLVIK